MRSYEGYDWVLGYDVDKVGHLLHVDLDPICAGGVVIRYTTH